MLEIDPLIQVIISLVILLLMGYIGYNIYLIELQNMFQGESDIRKEVNVLSGTYDFSNSEVKYNTSDPTQINFKDIKPSINQEGGAEYSYNFWLNVNQDTISELPNNHKDIILFLKGEKNFYYNKRNYNCANQLFPNNPIILTKNPLVRLSGDGKRIGVEYNNIYNSESYQHGSKYKDCSYINSPTVWNNRNRNILGIYDIEFNNKWFMITIVMKEVSDSDNILSLNRASCKLYMNGVKLLDKKVETKYGDNRYSATFKNNASHFYINPQIDERFISSSMNPYQRVSTETALRIADVKYYNYAINEEMITSLYNKGFNTEVAVTTTIDNKLSKYNLVSVDDMEDNKIKVL
uniref:Uncharacterized protein n=1 Tax=viral metagenome TaxID=1070528 RepID=A0A6C0LIF4_9ZZZZ